MDYFKKRQFIPKILSTPDIRLGICVVIPSYNETGISTTLKALANCQRTSQSVEVIVVVNHPENAPAEVVETSEKTFADVMEAQAQLGNEWIAFHAIEAYSLPSKHAGVGLARQIGMDEAAHRLLSVGKPNGVISCFDADSLCASNYLIEIEKLWAEYPKTAGCSIRYNHPTSGEDFDPHVYRGIAAYELHLRYYNQASRHIAFPFAFHTVGSSMACTAQTYIKIGGMNRHKAGEDFYFLQKIIPHGNFREINSTCVYPSPRPSDRVPFGTGRAMGKYLHSPTEGITTYCLQSFLDLVPFFASIGALHTAGKNQIDDIINNLPQPLRTFLAQGDPTSDIIAVQKNTGSKEAFYKRFFLWFDAFKLLKYLNYANEAHYQRSSVLSESAKLLTLMGVVANNANDVFELLEIFRNLDMDGGNDER